MKYSFGFDASELFPASSAASWFDEDLADDGGSPPPPSAAAPRPQPVVASFAGAFARRLAVGALTVHSVVGRPVVARATIPGRPVVTQSRATSPRVRSVVGRQTIAPAPAKRVIVDPTVATIKSPAPKALSWLVRMAAPNARGAFRRPVVALVRSPIARAESSVATQLVRAPTASPATSRARAILAVIRSPRPITESTIGVPLPRVTITTPAVSRARPLVATIRTPVPRVSSFRGPQGKRFLASHERWTRPITALVRSLRPVARPRIISPRPHIIPPAAPRPRPRVAIIRIPVPRVFSGAGSGKPSPAVLTFAIAVSRGTIQISIERATSDSLVTQQNTGTVSLGAEQQNSLALSSENYGTISLTQD
jgi:hypothetical protein